MKLCANPISVATWVALGCFALVGARTSLAATVVTTRTMTMPLHGCQAVSTVRRLCPTVLVAKPPAGIKLGTTVTFRGRVADPSKDFKYRISVSRGEMDAGVEITDWLRAHKAAVYPARRWKADVPGTHTVCVWGTHWAPPYPVAHDCRTFAVH